MPLAEVAKLRSRYSDLAELVDRARRRGRGRQAVKVLLDYLDGEISRDEALKRLRALAEARQP